MSTHRQHAGFCSNLDSNEVSFQLLWLSGIRISYEIYECAMSVTSGTANSNSYATCMSGKSSMLSLYVCIHRVYPLSTAGCSMLQR